jgi:hypothetical protein
MSIGFGIVLVVIGAILLFAVNGLNLDYISEDALGAIFILAGLATIGLAYALHHQRANTSHTALIEERRYDQRP